MAESKVTTIRPISDWQVQVLRCTAFYAPDQQFDISGWWAEMVGDLPETETKRVKEGLRIEEGPYKEGKLTLAKSPIAVDLRFQLGEQLPDEVNGVPTIGNFEEKCLEYIDLVKNKLFKMATFPLITRLAFGSIINLPSKDHKTGYTQLSEYIRGIQIDPNSSDFLYQINRRRASNTRIEGLDINRLSKWSLAKYQAIITSFGGGKTKATENAPRYACRLEIDISTGQEFTDLLPKENLGDIYDELVDMGKEIISRGDIK
ncbi:MAG: hypothetical protein FVQ84_09750 [Planctomycetes bacterium]|nr:hypothetical protein [Planctomycetota bacterium]